MSELTLQTLTHDPVTLPDAALAALEEGFHGELTRPGDAGYDDARSIYNGMIDKRPGLIARCADVADVIAAVELAREHDLLLSVRGGGHNGPGLALCEGGLVVDLSEMNGVRVDPKARTARVEGGARWADVDHATHAFGLATVSGVIASTGVGGLTLGGGHGYLTRKHGLTIDNLLAADVVLADGRLVHASESENSDLFWALRGGGGNFGIVTSFELRLHPVDTVIGGPMFWPLSEAENVLRWYRDFLPDAPDDLYGFFLAAEVPAGDPFPDEIHGEKVCGVMWCHTGSEEEAMASIGRAREVAEPLFEHVGPLPYPVLQSMHDPLYPAGLQWYWKGEFVRAISDAAIAEHLRFAEVPTSLSCMHLYPIDGAAHRVDPEETAWGYRDAHWSMVIAGVDPDPARRDDLRTWARSYWEALRPHCAGGAYVNFMMEEGDERVRATYADQYERLAEVKKRYDPENRFRVNQNIEPAA